MGYGGFGGCGPCGDFGGCGYGGGCGDGGYYGNNCNNFNDYNRGAESACCADACNNNYAQCCNDTACKNREVYYEKESCYNSNNAAVNANTGRFRNNNFGRRFGAGCCGANKCGYGGFNGYGGRGYGCRGPYGGYRGWY